MKQRFIFIAIIVCLSIAMIIIPACNNNDIINTDEQASEETILTPTTDDYFRFALLDDDTYEISARYLDMPPQVIIPATYEGKKVSAIAEDGFKKRESIDEIVIPDSVTTIGANAFLGSKINSLTIPSSVKTIGRTSNNYNLHPTEMEVLSTPEPAVYYKGDLATWCEIEKGIGFKYKKLFIAGNEIKELVIPDSITSLKASAFEGAMGLTSVVFSNAVTTIGERAFYGCTGLTSITIPDNVTSIDDHAFYGCKAVTSIEIGKGILNMGEFVFQSCDALTSVKIDSAWDNTNYSCVFSNEKASFTASFGNNVTRIGARVFYYCKGLKSVTIPATITTIEDSAFSSCDITTITLPESVTSIGSWAFAGCKIESITIPNSVTEIKDGAFSGCPLTSLIIPNSVPKMGECIINGCSSLEELTIPYMPDHFGELYSYENAVGYGDFPYLKKLIITGGTSIGGGVKCSNLTAISIPEGVTEIKDYAFYGCGKLDSINIPRSVTTIGEYLFDAPYSYKSRNPVVITYGGTESDWNAITKSNNWSYGVSYTINCSDGTVLRNYY